MEANSIKGIILNETFNIVSIRENYRGLLAVKAVNMETNEAITSEYKSKKYVNELLQKRFGCKRYDELEIYMA
jgi:hypothetical protein